MGIGRGANPLLGKEGNQEPLGVITGSPNIPRVEARIHMLSLDKFDVAQRGKFGSFGMKFPQRFQIIKKKGASHANAILCGDPIVGCGNASPYGLSG
jgi:hypothetical protein